MRRIPKVQLSRTGLLPLADFPREELLRHADPGGAVDPSRTVVFRSHDRKNRERWIFASATAVEILDFIGLTFPEAKRLRAMFDQRHRHANFADADAMVQLAIVPILWEVAGADVEYEFPLPERNSTQTLH